MDPQKPYPSVACDDDTCYQETNPERVRPTAPPQYPIDEEGYPNETTGLDETTRLEDESCQCPICLEDLPPGSEAMRCAGEGGVRHYFHAHCLKDWASSCRQRGIAPSCPVCRGPVQIHAPRLQSYLQSDQAQQMNDEDRGFLHNLFNSVQSSLGVGQEWSDPVTAENFFAGLGWVASAGLGFWQGYRGSSVMHSVSQDVLYISGSRRNQMANAVGFIAGTLVRAFWSSSDDSDRRRSRRR
eukprot:m.21992 g.21992  ORF g.21992 m.21992 type:complete len:241 (-) comp7308_c0_seq1:84-806(-)